jgi:hypothetical protein
MQYAHNKVNEAIDIFLTLIYFETIKHVSESHLLRPTRNTQYRSPSSNPLACPNATAINFFNMCIHYTVEFWTPNPNPNADVERRAVRGILPAGQNRAAKQKEFWLHDAEYLSRPRCAPQDVREGGIYFNRVFEFCFDDVDCRARIEQFAAEYAHYGQEVRRSERRRDPEARQKWLAQQWLRTYNDWVSVYENHKNCPQTRNRHQHFRALYGADVCVGGYGLPDRLRLGENPNLLPIPTMGIERTHTPNPRRR